MTTERIRQLQRAKEEAEASNASAILSRAEGDYLRQRAKEVSEASELEQKRQKAIKLMNESGVVGELGKISREFLGNVQHDIITGDVSVELVWGTYRIVDGKLTFRFGVQDFSYVRVEFSQDSMTVQGSTAKTIEEALWIKDRTVLTNALAEAYIHPRRVDKKYKPSSGNYSPRSESGGDMN